MDEELELQKRFTDCVYFLASPLTCKKGIECQYRHSEIARLNPRDCWYWLAGSCLNPACAFRHPPLDIHTGVPSKYAPSQDQPSSTKKVEVPCYFYFNGICNKGSKCSFLHGPNDALKVPKAAPAISDAPQLENKPSAGNNMESAPKEKSFPSEGALKVSVGSTSETVPISAETALKVSVGSQLKLEDKPSALDDYKSQSTSPNTSIFKCEETPAARLDTLLYVEGFQSGSQLYTDESSEEQVNNHLMDDDPLESSLGFDVLVDDTTQNIGYEHDAEYVLAVGRDLNDHFLGYQYNDTVEDAECLLKEQIIDHYDDYDYDIDERRFDFVKGMSSHSENDRTLPMLNRERKCLPLDMSIGGRRGVNMRIRLGKSRAFDRPRRCHFTKKSSSSQKMYHSHEQSRQYGRQMQGIGSLGKNGSRFNITSSSGLFGKSCSNISRHHNKEKGQSKRPFSSSATSRRSVRRKRLTEEHTFFSGPKTLDQIKEEKRRCTENDDSNGDSRCWNRKAEDFQGPKPLSEILKDKRKLLGCQ